MKVRKKFEYEGIELRIVDREETYMNSEYTMTVTRVLAPNGGLIPISIGRRQTLKSIVAETIEALDNFKSMGADIKKELCKPLENDNKK